MYRRALSFNGFVIAVRVSGGHLCEAEAPTESAGETAVRRAAIRFSPLLVIARGFSPVAIRFSFKENYGFFRAMRSE